jgi:hypothetical protein
MHGVDLLGDACRIARAGIEMLAICHVLSVLHSSSSSLNANLHGLTVVAGSKEQDKQQQDYRVQQKILRDTSGGMDASAFSEDFQQFFQATFMSADVLGLITRWLVALIPLTIALEHQHLNSLNAGLQPVPINLRTRLHSRKKPEVSFHSCSCRLLVCSIDWPCLFVTQPSTLRCSIVLCFTHLARDL